MDLMEVGQRAEMSSRVMALRLRLGIVVAGVVVALLAAFAVAQLPSQIPSADAREAGSAKAQQVDSRASTKYRCIVPRSGSTQCGNQFFVGRGKTLSVFLNTSGGKRVDFTTYDSGTGRKYGATRFLYPGQRKAMWKNGTRSGQYVYVRAASPSVVRVQAVGSYIR